MDFCPICNATVFEDYTATERMFGLGGEFHYRSCTNCQSLYLNETDLDLSSFYPEGYYAFQEPKTDSGFLIWLKKVRYQFFKLGLSLKPPVYFDWLSMLDAKATDSIADIGCGNGQLLMELQKCGFKNLYGFDPFITKEINSSGLKIRKIPFDEITWKFDVVMFHHSLEHMWNPVEVFERLSKMLNPGGKVLIRIPVTDAQVWKDSREYWFQLDAPRHLFIPNTKAIKLLCEKSNLELKEIVFDSTGDQFWNTELYKRDKSFLNTNLVDEFTEKELEEYEEKALLYNQQNIGDQACFVLRKKVKI